VNNAGALWWQDVADTPMFRFDLMHEVNARAAFAASQAVLPAMTAAGGGHIIVCSPPIDLSVLPRQDRLPDQQVRHDDAGARARRGGARIATSPSTRCGRSR
jgi:NAD(P)-dependent dehydrogenase (short-subunit alcohol dehydrogenase family)